MPEISKTADQALVILEYVAEHGPIGTSELARQLGLHRTVVHRLLATLHARSFVRRVPEGYLPGVTLLRISQFVEPELVAAARPVLESLASQHGETFILTIASEDDAVQIEQCAGANHLVRVELTLGFRHPLYRGASGRSILAFLPEDEIDRLIAQADDPAAIRRQLAIVRRDGFATSRDELSEGVHGVSVPVLVQGNAIGSIGVVVPETRAEAAAELVKTLSRAATTIARSVRRAGG